MQEIVGKLVAKVLKGRTTFPDYVKVAAARADTY